MSPAHFGNINHGDLALILHGNRHDAYAFFYTGDTRYSVYRTGSSSPVSLKNNLFII